MEPRFRSRVKLLVVSFVMTASELKLCYLVVKTPNLKASNTVSNPNARVLFRRKGLGEGSGLIQGVFPSWQGIMNRSHGRNIAMDVMTYLAKKIKEEMSEG